MIIFPQKKLIVLGTGAAQVTKCYNTCFILQNEKEYLLVDAGGGNQILTILEQKNIDIVEKREINHKKKPAPNGADLKVSRRSPPARG